jgi:hypothetical protein
MKTKIALSGLLLAGFVLSAAAQTTSYYIVQDAATHHCTIVDQRPVASTMTVVGPDGAVYKTRNEAETAMKTVKVCTPD